jgi:hypothetical protein
VWSKSCWKVPFPLVAAAASASDSSNEGGTGRPSLTAEAAAASSDTKERIDPFMMNCYPARKQREQLARSELLKKKIRK